MKKTNLITIIVALFALSDSAIAVTSAPINTAWDYFSSLLYSPVPPVYPTTVSTTKDDYWINIASYPPTTPAIGSSFFIYKYPTWAPPLPNSGWISAWNSYASRPGITPSNPSYTIFKKCFCLQQGFNQAKVNFQVRADDTIQIWLNNQTQTLLAASYGNYSGAPLTGGTSNQGWFHPGMNCIYVLVEDFGTAMGFNLVGTISANGLLPTAAKGYPPTFPFGRTCTTGPAGNAAEARAPSPQDDDQEVINEIVKIAEARRTAREKVQYQGKAPKK